MSADSFDLNEFLPYRLSVLANRISRAFAGLYSERFDLTVPEWRVMAVLGQEADLSAEQVCARTGMDKVTVSRAVARLLERGHVARAFARADRRRSELRLTARGRAVHRQIIPLARDYEARLAGALSAAERRTLFALLERLRPA
jgi:DNA-binding MarR family transcriptional regulator